MCRATEFAVGCAEQPDQFIGARAVTRSTHAPGSFDTLLDGPPVPQARQDRLSQHVSDCVRRWLMGAKLLCVYPFLPIVHGVIEAVVKVIAKHVFVRILFLQRVQEARKLLPSCSRGSVAVQVAS
jgi:hypothetical protein